MEKSLEGDLASVEVPDLLTFLHQGERSGVLAMERSEQETKLYLRNGSPVFAASTRDDLRLGALLVRNGRLTQGVIDDALGRQQATGPRLGQILVASQQISEAELGSFLKVQVSEVIFETFGWADGWFSFYEKVPPPHTAVTLEMALQNLLIEGVRRIDVRPHLSEVFPDLALAVEMVVNPDRVKHIATLTPEEWNVVFLLDGRRSLSEICRLAGDVDEAATLQILHVLLRARFAIIVPVPPTTPPSSAPVIIPVPDTGDPFAPKPASAPVRVSVEFPTGMRSLKVVDDTKEIVTPKAVQYLANTGNITVSRLVLVADGKETSFPLARDAYTLGRHRNNDIVISDPKVSSFHARIDRSAEGFTLNDLKSRNGTFLNGKRIETGVLKTGDEVRLGTARLLYKVDYTSG
ncbi:MAG TPA: DUF4388 domain-containing protein [Vicinamibacteria bacterium]|nr:DUF4388 domain-containing protein [Vicinamibacteria bacterium]